MSTNCVKCGVGSRVGVSLYCKTCEPRPVAWSSMEEGNVATAPTEQAACLAPIKLSYEASKYEVFRREVQHLINRYSMERGSNTSDFILAKFLERCLWNFDEAVNAREKWYGREGNVDGTKKS